MSLMVIRPLRTPLSSTTGSFSMRCLARLRFVEPRAHGRGHQTVLGHRVADRAVQLALELQVAVGDDAHQAPGVVHDRDARDAEPLHQAHRFAQRPVRPESDGVQDHPRLAAFHAVHLRRLAVHRHVLVDDADAALARDRDRHLRFGDRIHRGGHEGDVEGDAAGKARAHVHVPRVYAREPRNEQNVVESESGSRPEGSHGESYWAGGVSSTLSLSVDFFAASSTAAFPAAATFSSNFPAFPTASIVPLMMLTGTRPARSVSSSVSATRWEGVELPQQAVTQDLVHGRVSRLIMSSTGLPRNRVRPVRTRAVTWMVASGVMVSSCARLASGTTTYTNPRSGSGPRASMYVAPFGISGRSSSACCVEMNCSVQRSTCPV